MSHEMDVGKIEKVAEENMRLAQVIQRSYYKEKANFCIEKAEECRKEAEENLIRLSKVENGRYGTREDYLATGKRTHLEYNEIAANWLRMAAACMEVPIEV